ncbi:MAG: hypothetical protein HQ580_03090, partial [Planctomycetes bacterium]|nr:hypothetical protein [Planctomycetota bacterium]
VYRIASEYACRFDLKRGCSSAWQKSLIGCDSGSTEVQEWLEAVPSNRIMWGSDTGTAEGIYGATVFTRQCLAEALAEKVIRRELNEKDALRIARQVMRENALELFPQLKERLWRKRERIYENK